MAKVGYEESVEVVELLKDETGGLMHELGISTITFYKGDVTPASEALRAQLARVVAANPWLAGRLVKVAGKAALRHPAAPADDAVAELFAAGAATYAPSRGYEAICTELYKSKANTVVGSGFALLGRDLPLARLSVLESSPGEFAVVFSLSHAVADGRTYYEILRMLRPGADVRALATRRVAAFPETMRDRCNRAALAWVDGPAAVCQMLPLLLGCGAKARCHAFLLDDARVAEAKRAGAAGGGYVSTNDVLTSGFFVACGTTVGLMGLDCRGRLEGVGDDLAGNYVTALVMDDGVFGSPADLREMYATTPYATTTRKLPGACCAGKVSFAMVSDWASFAGDLVPLDGCELLVHVPVVNPAAILWDMMIPFASGKGRGVLCWTVSTDEAGLRKHLPVGGSVSDALFPKS